MKNKPDNESAKDKTADLRKRAEESLKKKPAGPDSARPEETQRLFYDLRVHQTELEMQNEELRRVQEELEVSRQKYFDLYDLAPVGYVTLDEQGIIKEANLAAAKLFGVDRSHLITRPLSLFIVKEDVDIYYAHRKRALEARQKEECELRMTKEAGSVFWVHIQEYVAGQSGAAVSRVTLSDITAGRRAEEALQAAYDELKRTQAQLLQAEKLASIGELVAGVAHEINNPLSYVMGNIRALNEYCAKLAEFVAAVSRETAGSDQEKNIEALGEKMRVAAVLKDMPGLIAETLEGAERIRVIVDNMRSFARPSAGEVACLDINQNIESTLLLVMNELKYKAEIVKEYGTIPPVSGNAQQLSQAFMNILMNSSQSIDTYGRISIRTYAAGKKAVVEISDNGRGIPPENIKKIFDPFFSTKAVGKGMGLGLSIVYGIIEKHRGTIEVQSEAGKGSTFIVRLPVTEGHG